jgi:pyrroline-5-carboxylate reductase
LKFLKDKKIAFIGAGNMGGALIKGLTGPSGIAAKRIIASDPRQDRLKQLFNQYRIRITRNNRTAAKVGDVVILAVKPGDIPKVAREIAPEIDGKKIVVSIAAGVTIAEIRSHLPKKTKIVRVMPNTPAMVLAGAAALAPGDQVKERDLAGVRAIFDTVGKTVVLDEKLMDAVTGLSGSGPAYVSLFIESLIDAGVYAGLPRAVAKTLAVQTVFGSVKMLQDSLEHPSQLRDMVTSPAGTTAAGLRVLEDGGFRGIVLDAVEAAVLRSKELGEERR